MTLNELRIGNVIKSKKSGLFPDNPKTIPWIISEEDMVNIISNGIENYLPVELTEEWLLGLGFKQWESDKSKWIYDEMYGDYITKRGGHWSIYDYEGNDMLNYDLKFVHQLQNLYFILTGKELDA